MTSPYPAGEPGREPFGADPPEAGRTEMGSQKPARVATGFGFASTADDVLSGVSLHGKRAVVTGASSGIGFETARALAQAGAEVTMAVRDVQRTRELVAGLPSSVARQLYAGPLDLTSQRSVREFVAHWDGPLHILVNNAGIMALPALDRTPEGWEMQFATNFMGHFTLTIGLHQALAAADGARIVSLSSSGSLFSPVQFDDLHFNFLPYDPFVAYGQSKTACNLLAVEATRRWAAQGVFANALNPGAIATNLQKYTGGLRTPRERQKTVQQGAATSVLLAASPVLAGIGGRYFEDCNEAEVVPARTKDFRGVAPYAIDASNAHRLWETALQLVAH
jgi:NAD(P)-dependent dehydrogenase (short-subunit alcohol dehydrogenase family)